MKFKNLILAGLALVSMAACSNEDDPQATQEPQDVKAYMQISITGAEGNTSRAGGANSTTPGSDVEKKITELTILLCNPSNHKVQYKYEKIKNLSNTTTPSQSLITDPIKTVTGTYKVYVIANPFNVNITANPDGISGTDMSTLALEENVTEATMKSNYANDNNFMMFNESLGKETTSYNVAPTITIIPTNDIHNPARLSDPIKLDRLAAKIVLSSPTISDITKLNETAITGVTNTPFASAVVKGFKLINGAQKVNLKQQWFFDYPETPLPALGSRLNTLVTPSSMTYYNTFAGFSTVTDDGGAPKKTYTAAVDLYPTIAEYKSAKAPIYCMENNPSFNGTSGQLATYNTATGLFFQVQVMLQNNDKPSSGVNETETGANTFYWYNGKYYFSLKAIQDDYTGVFDKASGSTGSKLGDAVAELVAARGKGDETTKQNAISDFRVKYMIKVFNDGIMYYPYYIKDKSWKQLTNGKGADNNSEGNVDYVESVMRNTIYTLDVKKLLKMGGDIPGNWNPKIEPGDPINPEDVYMQVNVAVNPWVSQSDDVELQ